MDHTTTTDIDALMAEVNALEAEWQAADARIEALLAQPVVITSICGRLAILRTGIEELVADTDELEAELEALA
jgi:outer membrane murein-binding lipoprotein Lpp